MRMPRSGASAPLSQRSLTSTGRSLYTHRGQMVTGCAMVRAQARSWASYAFGMVLYLWLFIGIYPSFRRSQALNNLLQTLPAGLLRVLGYNVGATRLRAFWAGNFTVCCT